MVKMTCVPNTIRIPTHGVDLRHDGLGFGERTPNRQWSHRKVKREERRRKERRKKEKERACPIQCRSHINRYGVTNARVAPTDMRDWIDVSQLPPAWRAGHAPAPPPPSHTSAHGTTLSLVVPTGLVRLKRVRSRIFFTRVHFSKYN
jgi:hypothetical protein